MKGDRTFHDVAAVLECCIEEMSVKFEIYARVQVRHQRNERLAAAKFVSRAHVGHRAPPKMLCLKQLSNEQVAIVNKCAELRGARAQPLHCTSAVYDISVRCIGQEFVEVIRSESSVALAQHDQFIAARDCFLEAPVDTAAIALLGLVDCGRPGLSCAL